MVDTFVRSAAFGTMITRILAIALYVFNSAAVLFQWLKHQETKVRLTEEGVNHAPLVYFNITSFCQSHRDKIILSTREKH